MTDDDYHFWYWWLRFEFLVSEVIQVSTGKPNVTYKERLGKAFAVSTNH